MDAKNETPEAKIAYWVDLADYDMGTARDMLKAGRHLYVGFMCNQVVEKALKACFTKSVNETPPFTHDLTVLAKKSGLFESMSVPHREFLDVLQPMNVQARYPTHKEKVLASLTPERCSDLLVKTEEVYAWIKQRLSL